jgi:hypothetical protein
MNAFIRDARASRIAPHFLEIWIVSALELLLLFEGKVRPAF